MMWTDQYIAFFKKPKMCLSLEPFLPPPFYVYIFETCINSIIFVVLLKLSTWQVRGLQIVSCALPELPQDLFSLRKNFRVVLGVQVNFLGGHTQDSAHSHAQG